MSRVCRKSSKCTRGCSNPTDMQGIFLERANASNETLSESESRLIGPRNCTPRVETLVHSCQRLGAGVRPHDSMTTIWQVYILTFSTQLAPQYQHQSLQMLQNIPMNQKLCRLQNLPLELHGEIFQLLDLQYAHRLTATCRIVRNSHRTPLSLQPKDQRDHFLYRLELFHMICLDAGCACFHCCTIEPRNKFSEDQLPMRKGFGFCIDCGERKHLYGAS